MSANYIQKEVMTGDARLEIHGAPFGATRGHAHKEQAIAVGSNIPAGLFVSYSPIFVGMEHGDCTERSVIVPDVTGAMLKHNDRSTTFEDSIADVLKNGAFKFVGVSGVALGDCKPHCITNECCPFGYPDDEPQHSNYWPRLHKAQVITQGVVRVYNESDVSPLDGLHVVVGQLDDEPCRYFGAITNTADDGTQPLDVDYRILEPAPAGQGAWIELGRK
jgi:hypothetical protein